MREHRNGDANAPFSGDPLMCAIEEYADGWNYTVEAARLEGFKMDELPYSWQQQLDRIRDCADWTRRRMVERDRRVDGGIEWTSGDIDEAGRS